MKPFVPAGGGLLGKRVPVFYLILAALIPVTIAWTVTYLHDTKQEQTDTLRSPGSPQSMMQHRMHGYSFIKPLLFVDLATEADYLSDLKTSISNTIESYKASGDVIEASAYIRNANDGSWTGVNTSEQYNPGSMLKIPILMSYLKSAEKTPSLLNRELYLDPRFQPNKEQLFPGQHLVPGKYKVKELLTSMIVNSDNYATMLLNMNIDQAEFTRVFTELGMPAPDPAASTFPLNVSQMSRFMRVLYSSTYLNHENSEYALELLSKATFNEGILKGIPSDIKVAHKFGESGDGTVFQLHETALVYIGEKPYMIVVMTKGNNIKNLPKVLTEISRMTYEKFKNLNS